LQNYLYGVIIDALQSKENIDCFNRMRAKSGKLRFEALYQVMARLSTVIQEIVLSLTAA